MRGQAPGRSRNRVLEQHTSGGKTIDLRRGRPSIAVRTDVISAQGVEDDYQYVRRARSGSRQTGSRASLSPPLTALDSDEYTHNLGSEPRKCFFQEEKSRVLMIGKPTLESCGRADSQ